MPFATGQDTAGELLASAEVYNPATNTFTAVANLPHVRSEFAVVLVSR